FEDTRGLLQEAFIRAEGQEAVVPVEDRAALGEEEADQPEQLARDGNPIRQPDVRSGFVEPDSRIGRPIQTELLDEGKWQGRFPPISVRLAYQLTAETAGAEPPRPFHSIMNLFPPGIDDGSERGRVDGIVPKRRILAPLQ